jgi:hypothetical protein
MSKNFLDEARKEYARLQAELEATELYQRMMLLEQVIAAYDGQPTPRRARALPEGVTKEQEIVRLAFECIDGQGGFAYKRAIHQRIGEQGIHVSDAALSAYLSKADGLAFDKTRGWRRAGEVASSMPRATNIVPLDVSAKKADGMAEQAPINVQQLWAADGGF